MATSNWLSSSQPLPASISSCSFACCSSSASIWSALISSANLPLTASYSARSPIIRAQPSSTTSLTVFSRSIRGSCSSSPTE